MGPRESQLALLDEQARTYFNGSTLTRAGRRNLSTRSAAVQECQRWFLKWAAWSAWSAFWVAFWNGSFDHTSESLWLPVVGSVLLWAVLSVRMVGGAHKAWLAETALRARRRETVEKWRELTWAERQTQVEAAQRADYRGTQIRSLLKPAAWLAQLVFDVDAGPGDD